MDLVPCVPSTSPVADVYLDVVVVAAKQKKQPLCWKHTPVRPDTFLCGGEPRKTDGSYT